MDISHHSRTRREAQRGAQKDSYLVGCMIIAEYHPPRHPRGILIIHGFHQIEYRAIDGRREGKLGGHSHSTIGLVVDPVGGRRDDTKVRTSTPDSPEEISILAPGDSYHIPGSCYQASGHKRIYLRATNAVERPQPSPKRRADGVDAALAS